MTTSQPQTEQTTPTPGPMRAVTQTRYGAPEVLQLEEVATPRPANNELLIEVRAASLNMFDVHMTTGYPLLARLAAGLAAPKSPIPGSDIAGVVRAVGKEVTGFAPGNRVFGSAGSGSFAEFAAVRAGAVSLIPDTVSFNDAAATPMAGITALQGLRDFGGLEAGQRVVINGASGGVGTFAVQIAKTLGAEVAAVCSTTKVDMVRSIGADRVIDYHNADYTDQLRDYDLVFDNAGDRPWSETKRVLNVEGTHVAVTGPKHRVAGPFRHLLARKIASRFGDRNFTWFTAAIKQDDLTTLGEYLASGAVTPVIERTYRLNEVPAALRYLNRGHALGKLVVEMS